MFFKEPKSSSAMSSSSINGEELPIAWFLPVCIQQIHGAWHDLALELFESSCFALFLFCFTIGTFPFIPFVDPRATAGIYVFFSNAPGSTNDLQDHIFVQTITAFLVTFAMVCFWTWTTHSLKPVSLHLPTGDNYCCCSNSLENKLHLQNQTKTTKSRLITEIAISFLDGPTNVWSSL